MALCARAVPVTAVTASPTTLVVEADGPALDLISTSPEVNPAAQFKREFLAGYILL
ncbi:hypothetical protein H4W29_005770 [Rhizobium viscosum]|uniref:Uncharacterized protein n=1 Tax=Rhizobium viscosum TaxID=1673 RepID=A0ABR9IZK9_RHIVS|nr:hypothetical protein [Rhizobium viscosum]